MSDNPRASPIGLPGGSHRRSRSRRAGANGTTPRGEPRSLSTDTAHGTLWNAATFVISKGLLLGSTVVLARLLTPAEFGLVAIGLVVISYLDVAGDLGMGPAIIYRKARSAVGFRRDSDTAFTLTLITAIVLAGAVVLAAPLIAAAMREPDATEIIRALSLAFLATILGIIHDSRLKKALAFRTRFAPEVGRAAVKAAVQIGLALAGFGVWSLVWGQVAGALIGSIWYWHAARWIPRLRLRRSEVEQLLRFGVPVTVLAILAVLIQTADQLIVANRLGATQLGYYTIALRMPDLLVLSVCYIASQALFPAYAKVQDDVEALRRGFEQTLRYMAVISVPVSVGLVVVAADLVPALFGPQWTPSVAVMQWLAGYALLRALSFNVGDVYKATGRPGVLNILASVRLVATVVVLWVVAPSGVVAVAQGLCAVTAAMTLLELAIASRLLSTSFVRIVSQFVPALVAGIALLASTFVARAMLPGDLQPAIGLLVTVPVGAGVYLATLWRVSPPTVRRIIDLVRGRSAT